MELSYPYNYAACFALIYIIGKLARRYFNGPDATNIKSLKGKTVIVTGSSDGIGVLTAKNLAENDATVIFACRNHKKTMAIINSFDEKLRANCIFMELDQASMKSTLAFCENVKKRFDKIDILVNNAGVVMHNYILTEDNIETTIQVNCLAPIVLTQELLPLLEKAKNSKIVNVASKSHTRCPYKKGKFDWDDIILNNEKYFVYTQYCYSKLGNVFFNQYLSQILKKRNSEVVTVALHPGTIYTDIAKDVWYMKFVYPIACFVMKTVWKGTQTSLHCCYADDLVSGSYYKDCALEEVHHYAAWKQEQNRKDFIDFAAKKINNTGLVKFSLV